MKKNLFYYIVASHLIEDLAPGVTNWRKKMSGKDSYGNPLCFTENDKRLIREAIHKLAKMPIEEGGFRTQQK